MTRATRLKLLAGASLLVALGATYWLLHETGMMTTILDGSALRGHIASLGAWGPVTVIGLMVLSFWRFAIATLAGFAPASFLPAHFGGEMATGEAGRIMWPILALGVITLIPLVVKVVKKLIKTNS